MSLLKWLSLKSKSSGSSTGARPKEDTDDSPLPTIFPSEPMILGKNRATSTVLTSWKPMNTGHMNFFRPETRLRDCVSCVYVSYLIAFRFAFIKDHVGGLICLPLKKNKRPVTAVVWADRPTRRSLSSTPPDNATCLFSA